MKNFKGLAWIVLAISLVPALCAETRCPGDVASVPLRLVNGYQIIVAVSINHSGPYDFLLDTGAQFTMIDPTLVAELHLSANGAVAVAGNGFRTSTSAVQLDRLDVGPQIAANLEVLEFDMQNIQPHYAKLCGILGEDFLEQFDMLIDNDHRMLCLDDTATLRSALKGPRIAMEASSSAGQMNSLIFTARLSSEKQPIRLKLDSGANAAVLYNASQFKPIDLIDMGGNLRGTGTNGTQTDYVALPPQDVNLGRVQMTAIPFFAPTKDISNTSDFDGLLPLRLFRRVFICHGEHFAILEAR